MHLVGVLFEKRPDAGEPFRHPRAFVEQRRRFEVQREVDADRLAAEAFQPVHGFIERVNRMGIAMELELLGEREGETLRQSRRRQCQFARPGILRIVTACRLEYRDRVGNGECKHRYAVERLAGGHHAARAHQAAARL